MLNSKRRKSILIILVLVILFKFFFISFIGNFKTPLKTDPRACYIGLKNGVGDSYLFEKNKKNIEHNRYVSHDYMPNLVKSLYSNNSYEDIIGREIIIDVRDKIYSLINVYFNGGKYKDNLFFRI